jgi:hypothetical protein
MRSVLYSGSCKYYMSISVNCIRLFWVSLAILLSLCLVAILYYYQDAPTRSVRRGRPARVSSQGRSPLVMLVGQEDSSATESYLSRDELLRMIREEPRAFQASVPTFSSLPDAVTLPGPPVTAIPMVDLSARLLGDTGMTYYLSCYSYEAMVFIISVCPSNSVVLWLGLVGIDFYYPCSLLICSLSFC